MAVDQPWQRVEKQLTTFQRETGKRFDRASTALTNAVDLMTATFVQVREKAGERFDHLDEALYDLATHVEDNTTAIRALDTKFGELDTKVSVLDTKVGELDTKVDNLDTKVEAMDAKFEGRFDRLEGRFDQLERLIRSGGRDDQPPALGS